MSYGGQINVFRAKADVYGRHWNGIVLCRDNAQFNVAVQDAQDMLHGVFNPQFSVLRLENGAYLRFRTIREQRDVLSAMRGHEYCHIIWLTDPPNDECRGIARSRLRSSAVPHDELRYEYATVL